MGFDGRSVVVMMWVFGCWGVGDIGAEEVCRGEVERLVRRRMISGSLIWVAILLDR